MNPKGCTYCGDSIPDTAPHSWDEDSGKLCMECGHGQTVARIVLRRQGIVGIFRGPCPDNDPPRPEPATA